MSSDPYSDVPVDGCLPVWAMYGGIANISRLLDDKVGSTDGRSATHSGGELCKA